MDINFQDYFNELFNNSKKQLNKENGENSFLEISRQARELIKKLEEREQ